MLWLIELFLLETHEKKCSQRKAAIDFDLTNRRNLFRKEKVYLQWTVVTDFTWRKSSLAYIYQGTGKVIIQFGWRFQNIVWTFIQEMLAQGDSVNRELEKVLRVETQLKDRENEFYLVG